MDTETATGSRGALLPALTGVLAAAAALGAGELVAGFTGAAGSPRVAVGTALIPLAPVPVKEFAVRTFGENDKAVLLAGVVAVLMVVAAAAGVLAARRPRLGVGVIALLGAVGVLAALAGPAPVSVLPSLCAGLTGVLTLTVLTRRLPTPSDDDRRDRTPVRSRRALLRGGLAVAVLAGTGTAVGRALQAGSTADASRARTRIPAPADPAPPLPAGHAFPVAGLTPFVTANADFYRVDTDLVLPQVPAEQWSLVVRGMVDHPMELTYAELLALPLTERHLTLSCVSNEVGGPYVSTARFVGVPLSALLRRAGVRAGAEQLLSSAADGMTIGTPVELVTDGRDALVALAMNGEPLPVEHGFPARLVVPGLFGYAGSTKWVTDLDLTTFGTAPYWVQRGYAPVGTARTASRIDVPRAFSRIPAGDTVVAGVAYAQRRGVAAVQVRVDDGPWRDAELTTQVSPDTWRQWRCPWQATPGVHRLQVRAADGRGELQPEDRAPVFPSGTTGWESIVVTVTT